MRKPLGTEELKKKADEVRAIIAEKITGKVTPEFTIYEHYYRLWDGNKVASTTTKNIIPKPHLILWAIKVAIEFLEKENRLQKLIKANEEGNEVYRKELLQGAQAAHTDVRDEAGSVGTDAHNAAEDYVKQWIKDDARPDDIRMFVRPGADPRSIASARSVEEFFKKEGYYPVAAELLVGSIHPVHSGAGMLDLLALDKYGDLHLLDYKTSNSIDHLSYSVQVGTYSSYFMGMSDLKIKSAMIIHLSKDSDRFALWTVVNIRKAYAIFKHQSQIYNWMHDGKPKLMKGKKKRKII